MAAGMVPQGTRRPAMRLALGGWNGDCNREKRGLVSYL